MQNKETLRNAGIGVVGILFLYFLIVGLFSSPSSEPFKIAPLKPGATDQERAMVIAQGLTYALDQELSSVFGFLPNDLIVPLFIDNTVNYQRGVIYATRPASEVVSKNIGRFGTRDTIDQRLADATSRYFSYSENVWGFLFVYDAESKYRTGIKNWAAWAQSVGGKGKDAGLFNLKSDDVYNIIDYCSSMTEYALGILNDANVSHFKNDDNVYFAKGVTAVTANVFRALIAIDDTIIERGGRDNIKEVLNRFDMIEQFNPIYVMAGGNKVGDAMMPNHVAALARHLDIANNRLEDILGTLKR